jgi:hypothetical protein
MSSLEGGDTPLARSESRGHGDCFFMANRVSMRHNLLTRKVIAEANDISCVLCEGLMEPIDHILVTFFIRQLHRGIVILDG